MSVSMPSGITSYDQSSNYGGSVQSSTAGDTPSTPSTSIQNVQDTVQLQSAAALIQTLTQPPSVSISNYPTDINEAVQETTFLQSNPSDVANLSQQSGSSGTQSAQDAVQLQSDATLVQSLTQPPSVSMANYPTNINQVVQDTLLQQNNPAVGTSPSQQSGPYGTAAILPGSLLNTMA